MNEPSDKQLEELADSMAMKPWGIGSRKIDAIVFARAVLAMYGGQAAEVVKLIKAYEWSSDYRCLVCGTVFNVQDDSSKALDRWKGHHCPPSQPVARRTLCS